MMMIATFSNQLTASEVWTAVLDVAAEGPLQVRRAAHLLSISEDEVRSHVAGRTPTDDERQLCHYLWARFRLHDETIQTYVERELAGESTPERSKH